MITTPTQNCASNFEILAETSKILLKYTHTTILATLIFKYYEKRIRFSESLKTVSWVSVY